MGTWEEMALVGRIGRPHGLKGQVVINPETDFIEERFAAGAIVWIKSDGGEQQLTVASMRALFKFTCAGLLRG